MFPYAAAMANPAVNVALIAAAQKQAKAAEAITEQLGKAGATNARAATTLDLGEAGSEKILEWLIARGHVREAGGGRYWLDKDAVAQSKSRGSRFALILLAFLLSAGASLAAILAA